MWIPFHLGSIHAQSPASTLEILPLRGENLAQGSEHEPDSLDENPAYLIDSETLGKFSHLPVSSSIRWG